MQDEKLYQRGVMYCKNCGQEIDNKAEICIKCGVRVAPLPMQQKNPAIAALLSFVVIGAGQVYNGEIGKGIILFGTAIISFILMMIYIGFFLLLAVWLYSIYDAYNTAEKINAISNLR